MHLGLFWQVQLVQAIEAHRGCAGTIGTGNNLYRLHRKKQMLRPHVPREFNALILCHGRDRHKDCGQNGCEGSDEQQGFHGVAPIFGLAGSVS